MTAKKRRTICYMTHEKLVYFCQPWIDYIKEGMEKDMIQEGGNAKKEKAG